MSDKLTQDDKWWLFCSSIPTGLAKKDIPVISVDTVKIKLHNLRFEQSEIEQQLLEANAKIERLEIAHLLMIDMHNDYHTCGEGDVDCTPCDKQDRAIEIFNETPTQSLALHDADVIDSLLDVIPWWHDKEFLKIDGVLAHSQQLRDNANKSEVSDD